jgi:hypothetical protein
MCPDVRGGRRHACPQRGRCGREPGREREEPDELVGGLLRGGEEHALPDDPRHGAPELPAAHRS